MDMAHIFRQSIADFGLAQADRYLDGLEAMFRLAAEYPQGAPVRTNLKGEVRVRPYESHFILYRVTGKDVLIVRILHAKQDLKRNR